MKRLCEMSWRGLGCVAVALMILGTLAMPSLDVRADEGDPGTGALCYICAAGCSKDGGKCVGKCSGEGCSMYCGCSQVKDCDECGIFDK